MTTIALGIAMWEIRSALPFFCVTVSLEAFLFVSPFFIGLFTAAAVLVSRPHIFDQRALGLAMALLMDSTLRDGTRFMWTRHTAFRAINADHSSWNAYDA